MSRFSPDEKWKKFGKELRDFMKAGDFFGLGTVYYKMADFLKRESKDGGQLRGLGYEMKKRFQNTELDNYASSEVVAGVQILGVGDSSCENCKKLNGLILTTEEANIKKLIPVKNCTHKYGCRCVYLPKVKRS
ncbi:MAG: hypothetical protein NT041_00875 [Candidatus Vogelbacteria bacterium]|nr:hypothetical protein [Candidatus Vogelbacteria bacterium]